jgi:hypothetical protein
LVHLPPVILLQTHMPIFRHGRLFRREKDFVAVSVRGGIRQRSRANAAAVRRRWRIGGILRAVPAAAATTLAAASAGAEGDREVSFLGEDHDGGGRKKKNGENCG